MMDTRTASYAAYLSGLFAILSAVFLILFFWLEAPDVANNGTQQPHIWGPLSDLCPIVQMLALLIVAQTLYRLEQFAALRFSLVTYLIGIAGTLGVSILQLLLIAGVIPFEQEVGPLLIATAVVGVWLILVNYLGQRSARLPARLARLGMGVGVALMLEPAFFAVIGGTMDWQNIMSNPLLIIGSALVFVLTYVGFPIWAFWSGHTFAAGQRESARRSDVAGTLAR
jgi:hypothetical protein